MWLQAPDISCKHGFSTRQGGISPSPFHALNLGGSQDQPENIAANRRIALDQLGLSLSNLCILKQVHGTTVCRASAGAQEGDALVTADPGLVLAVSIADCYPILFHDEKNGVAGAAHAGWRGTLGGIAGKVVAEMQALGAEPQHIRVAIGQGISKNRFEVGPEVTGQFKEAGFPAHCFHENKIDLVACNRWVVQQHHIPGTNIWSMGRCTFEQDFFSYRRDKGVTGRMWGLIALQQ